MKWGGGGPLNLIGGLYFSILEFALDFFISTWGGVTPKYMHTPKSDSYCFFHFLELPFLLEQLVFYYII